MSSSLNFNPRLRESRMRLESVLARWASSHREESTAMGWDGNRFDDPELLLLLEVLANEVARADYQREISLHQLQRQIVEQLDPNLVRSIPSCAIFRVRSKPRTQPGTRIEKGSMLVPDRKNTKETLVGGRSSLRYRTTRDLSLWGIRVVRADITRRGGRSLLTLDLESRVPLSELVGFDGLTFYLDGEPEVTWPLYEALMTAESVTVPGTSAQPRLRARGFEPGDSLLPQSGIGLPSSRLLVEFGVLPENFLFVDVLGFAEVRNLEGHSLRIEIELGSTRESLVRQVTAQTFALDCVPGVCSFPKKNILVKIDSRELDHVVSPSHRDSFEILDLQRVFLDDGTKYPVEIPNYFARGHSFCQDEPNLFYVSERNERTHRLSLRFLDRNGEPVPRGQLPERIFVDAEVFLGDSAVNRSITLHYDGHPIDIVAGPTLTAQGRPRIEMVGLSSPNTSRESGAAFRAWIEMLLGRSDWRSDIERDNFDERRQSLLHRMRQGLLEVRLWDDLAEVLVDPARSVHLPGRRCRIEVQPDRFPGESVFLFGQVLDSVLAERAGSNAFTQLILDLGNDQTRSWPIRTPGLRTWQPTPDHLERRA